MLLTLSTASFRKQIEKKGNDGLSLLDLPKLAINELQLRGLNVPASMLAGWALPELDRLRDAADKAGCPCLVLVQDEPLPVAESDDASLSACASRIERLAVAANRLGCNALGLAIEGPETDEAFDAAVENIKSWMPLVERHELNLLLMPGDGLTKKPERLTDLIKRIGGFRIGSLPTFAHAQRTGEPIETLRKLAPYAGAIHASISGFTKAGKHKGCDLAESVNAIRNVGFVNTLAIEYIGKGDPTDSLERARTILQESIDAEE